MSTIKYIYRFLFLVFVVFLSCNDDDVLEQQLSLDPKNITEIITDNSDLSTLSSALTQVKLDSVLSTTTTYTVFAPNNTAFGTVNLSGLSDENITNVLLNHVVQTVKADFTSTMTTGYLKSLASGPEGTNLSIFTNTTGDIAVNGMGTLVENAVDIGATNGVLHVVDGVLAPPTVVDHIVANPEFSMLAQAVEKAELIDALNAKGDDDLFTVFVPNNTAFEKFMMDVNGAFGWTSLDDIPVEVLKEVLLYHVVSGANVIASDVDGTTQTTMQEESFSISEGIIDDASYDNANFVLTDVQGINGVIHVVDKVLLPDNVFQSILSATLNIVERSDDRGFSSFLAAVEKAGMTDALSTTELTVFAPNNDAFIGLFATTNNFESLDDFDTPAEIEALADLLNYHLYAGALMSSELTDGGTISTVYGDDITVDLSGDNPRLIPSFTDAIPSAIVNANIGASNGIIHEINRVLVPDALLRDLGIETGEGGLCPVKDTNLVFFDWDTKGPWWGNVQAENMTALSADGSAYGRANFQTGGTGWQDLFWRNDASTFDGASTIGASLDGNSLKFDINVIEPITAGRFRIRFNASTGVDAFYDWAPWNDTGQPFTTDGWETIEIPLSVLGVPDFSIVDSEFGMAFEGADVLLNFAIDNVRFDSSGCGGPDPVDDPNLVFFDWDAKGPWWGNVTAQNEAAISLDGSSYGRANFQTGGTGWQDLFWRNDATTFDGASTVGSDVGDYALKFDIYTLEPLSAGMFRIRFNASSGVDAFYNWEPWNDTGNPFDTEGDWVTVSIPCSVLGVPDFSLVDSEFGMAFEGADVLLNFAIDNVRFERL